MASNSGVWSLCLTSRQGRKIVQLPPTSTIQHLYDMAQEQFGIAIASLKYGFPPKTLDPIAETVESILQNQERIQVEFGTGNGAAQNDAPPNGSRKAGGSNKTTSETPSSSPSTGRSKRAAAKRATENMPAVIKAQEKLLKEQTSKRQRTTSSSSAGPATKRPSKPKFTADVGQGRRLADGATIDAPTKGRKRASPGMAAQGQDMSEALLGALNDSGKMGQVLRKGMKNAVQASYETTRAFSRLAAVQAKTYTMTVRESGASSVLVVSYRGSVDKTKTEEQMDRIPRDILEAVLKGIHASNTEALRPENMAILSPRVFWSLVHIFSDQTSVAGMYKQILPDLDWSFLRRRAQQLSDKALENLRQEQQAKGQEAGDGVLAAQAIAAVEHAMENLHDYAAAERQARQAQAALSRLQGSNNTSSLVEGEEEWKLVTPSEPDRDELYECIQGSTSRDVTTLIRRLMRECQIHNWRELANVEDVSALAEKLEVQPSQVQIWVDRAQNQSVDEIIVEICDDNVRAVELLTETARSGTPKDLAAWRNIPQLLHQRMAGIADAPTVKQLQTWSQRAHQLLKDFEWLNWYATPVE